MFACLLSKSWSEVGVRPGTTLVLPSTADDAVRSNMYRASQLAQQAEDVEGEMSKIQGIIKRTE
eukprot:CAMPEP_0172029536 /NCGR_PEP_ID=MMETSP1041-20130122/18192_1 /TAXON_ID=464988 /ORGANISM="Hemiselmis andersenii, Strain CCMP439" /LENGTH=63 /DNA_ID=CAMNT_0012685723 /DNA_START=36 /DNA_END=224 /DNA_ORIENTATION=+